MIKILAHRFLPPEYDVSIYVDGNMQVRGDVRVLCNEGLTTADAAFFDHAKNQDFSRDCIYDEADALQELNAKGKQKEEPEKIRMQVEVYRREGYPAHHGLVTGMVIARRHNEPDVTAVMEAWWHEVVTRTKRDQLSFNYVAWKMGFRFAYLDGDSTDNRYVLRKSHRLSLVRKTRARLAHLKTMILPGQRDVPGGHKTENTV
jgi:hypothetical protein